MKARHQVHLGLHPLYLQLDLIEPGVDPDRDVDQVGELGQDGDVGSEVSDLKRYPVDLQLGDIEHHVWLLAVWLLAVRWRSPRSQEECPSRSARGQHAQAEPPEARRHPSDDLLRPRSGAYPCRCPEHLLFPSASPAI